MALSAIRRAVWRQLLPDGRSLWQSALAMALALALAGVVLLAAVSGSSLKPAALVLAVMILPVAAQASGNPRLLLLWCLMFALPFDLSMYLGPFSSKGGGERAFRVELSDVFYGGLLLFQARDLLRCRWPGLRVPKVILVWLGIMLFWGLDSVINGPYRTTAAHEIIRMLKMTVLFIVLVNELDSVGRLRHAAAAITLGMAFQSCIGILQYLLGHTLGLEFLGELSTKTLDELSTTSVRDAKVFRIAAFIGHPNLLGVYLAACLPLAVCGLMYSSRLPARLFFGVALASGGVALILTQSRSGWASFAAALLLVMALMVMHQRLFKRSLSAIAVATVALALLFGAFQEPIMRRLFSSLEQAATGREEFKEDARRLIDEKVMLGWGLNQYTLVLPPYMKYTARSYSYWIPPVHNIYYLWWAETGLVGLGVHLAMWAAIMLRACRNLRSHDETLFLMSLACLGAMVAFAVDGFMSFSLRVNQPQRVFFVLAAMIYATHYLRQDAQRVAR